MLYRRKQVTYALYVPVAVLTANLLSHVLKAVIGRQRPPLADQLLPQVNPAMPSGHTVGIFALAMASSLVWRTWKILPLWILAVVVSISRLYVGVHWLTDVLAGALIGITVSMAVWWVNRKVTLCREVT